MTRTQIQAQKAKDAGYKYIASVVKSHYNTTYYHVNSVDSVITNGWTPCTIGQYNNWHGRIGRSKLPNNTILRTQLFNL